MIIGDNTPCILLVTTHSSLQATSNLNYHSRSQLLWFPYTYAAPAVIILDSATFITLEFTHSVNFASHTLTTSITGFRAIFSLFWLPKTRVCGYFITFY